MKNFIITIIVIAIIGALYYFVGPLFNVQEVNDTVPSGVENLTEEQKVEMDMLMEEMKDEVKEMEEETPEMISISGAFPVMGTFGHPASGSVRIIENLEETIIRYEDFETINGPNLHVYLSKDIEGKDFIDLGEIRGTKGNINYTVPEGVDLNEYRYVMYWCVPFAVLFNYAEING
ncbi:MAG: DM13 domain-containing protein [Patescibacteria group bacterium UBA2103]